MLQYHIISINNMEAVNTKVDTSIIVAEEDVVRNAEEIGVVDEVVG